MGAACCVSSKGLTVANRSPGDSLQRRTHCSPNWSCRWDSRGRVAGEETRSHWVRDRDGGCGIGRMDVKFGNNAETAFASEEGSPLDSFRSLAWQKSPLSEGNSGTSRVQSSDQIISQNTARVKESTYSPSLSYPSLNLSPSVPSVSSNSPSPFSSQSHLFPPNSTPSRCHYQIPKSPSFSISEEQSPYLPNSWGNESTRVSNGGSFDTWSNPALSELVTTRRERWSFDSATSAFSRDKIKRCSERSLGSPSFDLQTCSVCTNLLTDQSSLGLSGHSHTILYANDLAVVSVLTCGHVYHSECLEYMTPEVNKYDPACPVCTFGEKRVMRMMSEKALKAEMGSKARKRSRKRVVDSDLSSGEVIMFDHQRSGGIKLGSSSSMKGSGRKPFLRRHFSFVSKTNSRSFSDDNQSTPRRGFFWARSSKD